MYLYIKYKNVLEVIIDKKPPFVNIDFVKKVHKTAKNYVKKMTI